MILSAVHLKDALRARPRAPLSDAARGRLLLVDPTKSTTLVSHLQNDRPTSESTRERERERRPDKPSFASTAHPRERLLIFIKYFLLPLFGCQGAFDCVQLLTARYATCSQRGNLRLYHEAQIHADKNKLLSLCSTQQHQSGPKRTTRQRYADPPIRLRKAVRCCSARPLNQDFLSNRN